MKKTNDFGAKIGGARKDLWSRSGLKWDHTLEMTESEKEKYVVRDNIWPRPKLQELLASGIPRHVIFWREEVRKSLYPKPDHCIVLSDRWLQTYTDSINEIRGVVETVVTEEEMLSAQRALKDKIFGQSCNFCYHYEGQWGRVVNGNAFLKSSGSNSLRYLKSQVKKKNYLMSAEEIADNRYKLFLVEENGECGIEYGRIVIRRAMYVVVYSIPEELSVGYGDYILADEKDHRIVCAGTKEECLEAKDVRAASDAEKKDRDGKTKFLPPQFDHIVRDGSDYERFVPASGEDLMERFNLRAGEFGNWANEKERALSLAMFRDAFYDLAAALGVDPSSVGLNGINGMSLAIAFGSRGMGGALAHYEPDRAVINITKKRGAGSLAHEWGHALDDFIGKVVLGTGEMATERNSYSMRLCLPEFKAVLDAMGQKTDYYKQSKEFDRMHSKAGNGYWSSPCEMFARAFACYVKDRISGRSDFLVGHADCAVSYGKDGQPIYAYPRGEERKTINDAFDKLIAELKRREYLESQKTERSETENSDHVISWESFKVDEVSGQLSFI